MHLAKKKLRTMTPMPLRQGIKTAASAPLVNREIGLWTTLLLMTLLRRRLDIAIYSDVHKNVWNNSRRG
jgi:hypothetical protein